jgi:general secretion pathway protein I
VTLRQGQSGFTLIEVLVALVIVAFGMGALMAALSSSADTSAHLREKSLAEWVALNRISEVRLRGQPPGLGKSSGDADFAGRKFRWTQEIVDPGIAGIRRIDISVARAAADGGTGADAGSLAIATGFIGLATAAPSGIEPDWSLWSVAGAAAATGAPPTPGPPANPGGAPR